MTTWLLSAALYAGPAPALMPVTCEETVRGMYEGRRFVDAARAAEQCWKTSHKPLMLFFAAQARMSAGYVTHAVLHLEAYLKQPAEAESSRARARKLLAEARAKTVLMTLDAPPGELVLMLEGRSDYLMLPWPGGDGLVNLEPGNWRAWFAEHDPLRAQAFQASSGGSVTIRRPRTEPPILPRRELRLQVQPWRSGAYAQLSRLGPGDAAEMKLPLSGAQTNLMLLQGRWRVTIHVPGREVVQREVELNERRELVFAPERDRATKARLGLGVGLGGASLLMFVWGGVWASIGKQDQAQTGDGSDPAAVQRALDGYGRRMDGAAVLGTGLGMLGVAVTNVIRAGRKVLAIETGLGAGLLVGGAIGFGVASRRPRLWDPSPQVEPGDRGAAVVLGLGAGLAGAGLISLVTKLVLDRKGERVRKLDAIAGMSTIGIQGRF